MHAFSIGWPNWIGDSKPIGKDGLIGALGQMQRNRFCPSDKSHPSTQFPTPTHITSKGNGLSYDHVNCERDAEPSIMLFSKKVLPFSIVTLKFVIILFCYLQFNFINHFQIFPKFCNIYALLDLSMLIKKLLI